MNIIEQEKELVNYDGDDKVISSQEMKVVVDANSDRVVSFNSTMPTLDKILGGFEGGELTVISGLTGNGKTLLAQTLTHNFDRQGIKSLWFSYEVLPRNFLKSFGDEFPNFYMPSRLTLNSIDWLEQRIWEAKLKYDCRVVFIDHLHFLLDMKSRLNMSLEIGHVMRSLKGLAIKYNLVFFLIAHTAKVRPDTELDLDSLRDSSFIGQEADNVFMVWRKINTANDAVLKVVKNRKHGTYGKIDIFKNPYGLLWEVDNDHKSELQTGGAWNTDV